VRERFAFVIKHIKVNFTANMPPREFRTTANSCRKIAVENQNVMSRYDKYDTNFPSVKSLNRLKINGKDKNKDLYTTETDIKRHEKMGYKCHPLFVMIISKLMGNKWQKTANIFSKIAVSI